MSAAPQTLELLSPARDAETGIAAIDHGADAVYIGGPAFGARAAAGNRLADIERLASYAHRYSARVFVTLNTILRDDELAAAQSLAHGAWEAGADALIVQDMGLLELDLPPIALHASTQTDIRTPEKARFLEQVGFSQLVLARELSLAEIRAIAAVTTAKLEFFVHGALCVSYSGQCRISHALTGRSANRGECAQICRLPFSLTDAAGQRLATDRHLLSLKDNDQSANLRDLIEAGIRSFKIEGRLKDAVYVKNITAHYRRLLDEIIDDPVSPGRFARASAGRCRFLFTPDPQKTFHRGATDYFVRQRQEDIAAFDTPKFAGSPIGRVRAVGRSHFDVETAMTLHNGDGLSFFADSGELLGLRINRAEAILLGWRLHAPDGTRLPAAGSEIFRNLDQQFEKALQGKSSERRIDIDMHFAETADGFALTLRDEEGNQVRVALLHPKTPAQNGERAAATIREQLGKLGNSIFAATAITLDLAAPRFLPASALNGLRRDSVAALEAVRANAYRQPPREPASEPPARYPEPQLGIGGNVLNERARTFYTRHGVERIADAYETNREPGAVALMLTRHCLRYSLHLCPKQVKGIRPESMTLSGGGETLQLDFDCRRCEMQVIGRLRKARRRQ